MKRKVVVGQSSVTAGQLKDQFRMIEDGTIGFEEMRDFLANPRKSSKVEAGVTLVRALNILGDRKVLTAEQAAKAWNQPIPENTPIRHSKEALRECAEMNRHGADWRLVYALGLSLREQRQIKGLGSSGFYNNNWWLETKEDDWATQKPEPGYYLIDFKGRWGKTSWNRQEEEIAKLGPSYERAHEAVISEAVFSIYQIYQERLLENWYHWGRNLGSFGGRVDVGGFFVRDGLGVGYCLPDWDDRGFLRVCLARKFQF